MTQSQFTLFCLKMDRNISFPLTTGRRTLGFRDERSLREAVFGSKDFVQRMKLDTTLDVHRGCVNTISWNDHGSLILSGSDDKKLCFTNPYTKQVLATIPSGHRSNIFSAKFLPVSRDRQVVSCSGDGCIMFSDLDNPEMYGRNSFNCHYGTAYEVVTLPSDPNTFMSCGEDGTVRWFDLRIKTSCNREECKEDVMINCRRAVTGVCVNPILPYQLAVGCSDSSVRIFDRRMLGTKLSGNHVGRGMQGILCRFCPSHLQNKYSRPTSLTYSANGQDLLVSYSSDYIYLFGTNARYKENANGEASCGADNDGLVEVVEEDGEDKDEFAVGNPVKRLRLRGDWSDTGPRARPRSEQPEGERPRSTMVQRMSEMLSRWLEESSSSPRRPVRPGQPGVTGSSFSSSASTAASTSGATSTTSSATPSTSSATGATSMTVAQDASRRETADKAGASKTEDSSRKMDVASGASSSVRRMWDRTSEEGESVSQEKIKDVRSTVSLFEGAIGKGADKQGSGKQDKGLRDSRSEGQRSVEAEEGPAGWRKGLRSRGKTANQPEQRFEKGSDETAAKTGSPTPTGKVEGSEKDSRNQDEPKKGIFALGDRLEDKNPVPRLTKQDSLELSRSRKKSVVDGPPDLQACSDTNLALSEPSSSGAGKTEDCRREREGSSEKERSEDEGEGRRRKSSDKSEENKKEEKTNRSSTSSMQSVGSETSQSAASSHSMTCSESDSDEELQLMGAEREKKTPHQLDAPPNQPRERVRSEAEMRLRELFKTRKEEREKEAEIIKNVYSPSVEMVYKGHRNSRTMIKEANFWGDHYIVSGSDCGHIFIWDRYTAKLIMLLEGDKHVVNCIQPHPVDPILATSGIDYNVKLWAPLAPEPYFPENSAEVMRINELMLEETRDTITVPPSFMLRMLASLNHLRGERRRSSDPQSASESSDD